MLFDKEIAMSPAEWQIWKDHPMTARVFDVLAAERSCWVERLAFGDTLQKSGSEIKETAETVGIVKGLTILLEDFEITLRQQWEETQTEKERMARNEE